MKQFIVGAFNKIRMNDFASKLFKNVKTKMESTQFKITSAVAGIGTGIICIHYSDMYQEYKENRDL